MTRFAFRKFTLLAGALLASGVLSGVAATSARAQSLTYTLSNVIFQDGATASGSFDYNPTTNTYGMFSITTTAGVLPINGSVIPAGFTYTNKTATARYENFNIAEDFVFDGGNAYLALVKFGTITGPGTYALAPGVSQSAGVISNSGEFISRNSRGLSGSLIVTNAAAVPEPSEYAAAGMFGATLLFGMVKARRKKAAHAA